jgi:hypothetical protein
MYVLYIHQYIFRNNNNARILVRRYPLNKKAQYRHLDVGINVSRLPSRVTIILGDWLGKELPLTPKMWMEILNRRRTILLYFRDGDVTRLPSPIFIDHLTIRFGKKNNAKILRLEASKVRFVISMDTVLRIFNLELCVNRVINSLTNLITSVDNKLSLFLEIAANVKDPVRIPMVIRDSESFDRNDLIDCELQALIFEI